ncbi:hypothetical protein SteCoe_14026 [Stentor coeruleus]|uniref:Chromo domain-containing protein n=1 Tax=Stentor coeruleus TaxID=5963 RepID=A0A1R2C6X5_9CILI|nr:hypothetical protein SteCoe_14026 [Stentor coeruleus]
MVKSRKSMSSSGGEYVSTGIPEEKKKTIVLDEDLSPLVCRKLKFEIKKQGNFKECRPKKILDHYKVKGSLYFDVEWDCPEDEFLLPSKVTLLSVRKNCPDLLIDYLLSKL